MKKVLIIVFLVLISGKIFSIEKPPYKPATITSKYVLVTGNVLRMRSKPVLKSRILGKLYLGQKIELFARSKNDVINKLEDYWYKVKFKNKTGYVFGQYLIPFQNMRILIAEKVGRILIFSKRSKIRTISYKSFYKRQQHLEKNLLKVKLPIKVKYEFPKIIDDKFIVISHLTGFYHSDGYINYIGLFNIFGKRFAYFNSSIEIKYSKKHKMIICNPQKRVTLYDIQPANKLYFYNIWGRLLRKIKVKLKFKKENKYYSKMRINKTGNKLIWLDNDTRCTIDLKSFKVNFFKYEIDLDAKNK